MSYYNQQGQNPQFAPQGQNPQYGWNPQANQQQQANRDGYQSYQSVPAFQGGNPSYMESGEPKMDLNFNDQTIRAAFVRKVFSLVTIMLGVVAVMTAVPFFHEGTMHFVRTSPGIYWLSYGTFFVVYLALMCCESVRRSFPSNLICTGVLTLAIGYMTMMISAMYGLESVLIALAITTLCCASIIIFSMQTKYDLTSCMGFIFIASMVVMTFGFVAIIGGIFFKIRFLYTIYAGLAALLFMVYLAIDIQMIMGGRKYEISPEDHIFAAIQVFLDVVYIFWMILSLVGSSNN